MDDTTITTIRDAERLVEDWTITYRRQPTPAQIHRAARALVAAIGGYGNDLTEEIAAAFDLDSALEGE